jgi:hypothetical protein
MFLTGKRGPSQGKSRGAPAAKDTDVYGIKMLNDVVFGEWADRAGAGGWVLFLGKV